MFHFQCGSSGQSPKTTQSGIGQPEIVLLIYSFYSKNEMCSFQLHDLRLVSSGLCNGFHVMLSKEYILFFFYKFLLSFVNSAQFSFI